MQSARDVDANDAVHRQDAGTNAGERRALAAHVIARTGPPGVREERWANERMSLRYFGASEPEGVTDKLPRTVPTDRVRPAKKPEPLHGQLANRRSTRGGQHSLRAPREPLEHRVLHHESP